MTPGKKDFTLRQVAAKASDSAGDYVAIVWVGLRADGTYDHGTSVPAPLIPRLVETVGAVLRKVVAKARPTTH